MKKSNVIFLTLLACAFGVSARTVSQDEIQYAARAWVHRGKTLGVHFPSHAVASTVKHTTTNSAAFYTVKMVNGGTVFMSGDTDYEPVIGFTSVTNDFSTIDPASPLWTLLNHDVSRMSTKARPMLAMATMAAAARQSAVNANGEKWATLISEGEGLEPVQRRSLLALASSIEKETDISDLRVPSLVKSQWSQGSVHNVACYNYYTPNGTNPAAFIEGDANNAVCGCVATAMAQIMRYFEYPIDPVQQVEHVCAYDGNAVTLKTKGGTYAWDKMPLKPGSDALTPENRQEIGKLTSDAGISVWMDYSSTGSGAYTPEAGAMLRDVFNYKNAICFDDASGLLAAGSENRAKALQQAMFANFDAGMPVLVSIPGHAVVADGYGYVEDVDYVHFNMGWAGYCDYWYNIPDLTDAGSKYSAVNDIIYNIFTNAAPTCAVMSGRAVDDEGLAVADADVTVFNEAGDEVAQTKTNERGIWSALLEAGTYDVVVQHGRMMAENDGVVLAVPASASRKWVHCNVEMVSPLTPASLGNSWGNDTVLMEPCVTNITQGRVFASLDKALATVDEGDEIAILLPAAFKRSVTLTKSCTIFATNDNAAASMVERLNNAQIAIAGGAALTLSNVVFSASTEPLVDVEAGGGLKICEKVGLGVALDDGVAIVTADADGFELAGALTEKIRFRCAAAQAIDQAFGSYSCDAVTATNSAVMIVCEDDIDRETRGGVSGGQLVWRHVNVPMDEAVAYFVPKAGKTNTYARMARALAEFKTGYDAGKYAEFVVRRNGGIALPFDVSRPLTFRGEGSVRPVLTVADTSGFQISADGSLTVSNLVFSGYVAPEAGGTFIEVDGGALTLDEGAVLDGIVGRGDYRCSGVIDLFAGTMTMREGAAIVNCSAVGDSGCGGAVYVEYADCVLNLEGGMISNCFAKSYGGGIYASEWNGATSLINVSGELTVVDNQVEADGDSDICLETSRWLPNFRIVGNVEGRIGVMYATSASIMDGGHIDGNYLNEAFMTNAVGILKTKSLRAFFNDTDAALTAATNGNGKLIWVLDTYDPRLCDEEDAAARLIAGSSTSFWWKVSDALNEATNNCVVEVLRDTNLTENVAICGRNVTLRSAAGNPYGLALYRAKDVQIAIDGGDELVVTNLDLMGRPNITNSVAFIEVDGGKLSLLDADIFDMVGNGDRNANAVTVTQGGELVMDGCSQIDSCHNLSLDPTGVKETEVGVGGGILIDNATAEFGDVYVSNCRATKGGGVFVCNGSTVRISGLVRILDNESIGGKDSNLEVSDNSELIVDDELTGRIYMTPKTLTLTQPSDTNVIATVSADWHWSVTALTNTAVCFKSDVSHDVGVAVTNGTKAIIVWSQALKDGVYANASDGKSYALAGLMPDIRQCDHDDEYLALARLTDEKGVETYWWHVDDALGEATNNCAVTVLGEDILSKDIVIKGTNVVLCSPDFTGFGFRLCRARDVSVRIPAKCGLTVSTVEFDGDTGDGSSVDAFLDVCGGKLDIDNVGIYNVTGTGDSDAGAIVVSDGGFFSMTNSQILACTNDVAGGALLVDNATACLFDGEIADCQAPKGAGVFACHAAKVYVGGQMYICDNVGTNEAADSNLELADTADLCLTNALDGCVGMTARSGIDSNIVAHVAYVWTNGVTALATGAADFVRDGDGEKGAAVTNGTTALIVWCGAVKDGVYSNAVDGVKYLLVESGSTVLPPLTDPRDIPAELDKLADAEALKAKIKTIEEYDDFREWADGVEGGKEAVAASDKACVSYVFGASTLFEDDPEVSITEIETDDDTFAISVIVKDGEDPVTVAGASVGKLLEATRDVTDWNDAGKVVTLTVVNTVVNADKSVTFTVEPEGNPSAVFIRLKY